MTTIETGLTVQKLREAFGALADIPALDIAVTPLAVAARVGEGCDLAQGRMIVDPFTGRTRVDVRATDDTPEARRTAAILAAVLQYQLETTGT